ncbi:MAG: tetratricopeptide repeat protein [Oligoflexia bacterium]
MFPSMGGAVESHPGLEAEASYSEAVVAFHRKQSGESIQILNRLLQENPSHIEALELKALNLKALGREKEMLSVYEMLLKAKPPSEHGPLYFELGSLQHRQNKPALAKRNLLKAIELQFNAVPAHLLVGMMDFNLGDLGSAESHFKIVNSQDSTELEMVASFYLGLINLKRGRGGIGAGYILNASDLAEKKKKDSQMAQNLSGPIQRILEPFSQSRWFMNVSMLGQYDSNISQIPTAATAQQGTGIGTAKTTVLAGFGYMSAPLSLIQFVPSYRFNANKNFSETARVLEYASNTVTLALNVRPLGLLTGGIKGELTHTFQNQPLDTNDSSAGYVYRQFSLAGDLGPYVRWTPNENLQLMLEVSVRPQVNYAQSDLGGTGYGAKLSYRRDAPSRSFNPGLSFAYSQSGTQNLSFDATAYTLSFSNLFRLPGDYQATTSLDLASTRYAQAVPERQDSTVALRGTVVRPITATLSLLADASFVMNRSNISGSFTYDRWQTGIGVSFTR